ncbi:hypothetical protein [Nitrospira sp. Nam74]
MGVHPLAGTLAPAELLIDVEKLERAYHDRQPDLTNPNRLGCGQTHAGSGKRCRNLRIESRDEERLVCGAAFRH